MWRRRSAVLVYVIVLLPALVGLAALAVDIGYLYRTQAQLQNAADSAALAAASGLRDGPQAARARATDYAARNEAAGTPVALIEEDIELGRWDAQTRVFTPLASPDDVFADACRVTARRLEARGTAVPLTFGGLLGRPQSDVTAKAVAQFGTAQSWDVIIVQDVSGSFNDNLPAAHAALRAFVECVAEHSGPQTRIGIVAFDRTAWLACPPTMVHAGVAPLTSAIDALCGCCTIGACCPWQYDPGACCRPCCGTDVAAGLLLAASVLPTPLAETKQRAVILVSDGLPNQVPPTGPVVPPQWCPPPLCALPHPPWQDPACMAQIKQQAAANAVAAANLIGGTVPAISLFVIYYGDQPDALGFLQGLVQGDGMLHDAPDPALFSEVFWQICATLPIGLRE